MFTLHQIQEAHAKVKSGADFPQYVQDLKAIGISHYDNFVADGRAKYFGLDDFSLDAGSKYPEMQVNEIGSVEALKHALSIHQKGQTDYPTFCKQAADAGVEKWTTHALEMTVTYYDKQGNKLIVEQIPIP